jgi:hypothetical protein
MWKVEFSPFLTLLNTEQKSIRVLENAKKNPNPPSQTLCVSGLATVF